LGQANNYSTIPDLSTHGLTQAAQNQGIVAWDSLTAGKLTTHLECHQQPTQMNDNAALVDLWHYAGMVSHP